MAKTETIPHSPPSPAATLAKYCPTLEQWPESWRFEQRDLGPGQALLPYFKPFLLHLVELPLSPKTIRKHADNMWTLGGEIIRHLQEHPQLRKQPIPQLLQSLLHQRQDGPLLYHCDSEQHQQNFDSTCRKFWRFLSDHSLLTPGEAKITHRFP